MNLSGFERALNDCLVSSYVLYVNVKMKTIHKLLICLGVWAGDSVLFDYMVFSALSAPISQLWAIFTHLLTMSKNPRFLFYCASY